MSGSEAPRHRLDRHDAVRLGRPPACAWPLRPRAAAPAPARARGGGRTRRARHYVPMVTAGWAGVAGLAFAAFAMHGMARAAVLALCAPLCGLSFWARTDGGGGGGGDDGGPDPDDGPGDDDVDWDRFMSDLDRYAARRREPVAR